MKTKSTTLINTINQSVQVVCSVYYRLGETVMGRLVSIQTQCELARPGEAVARRPVGCRLSSHYKTGTWQRLALTEFGK